MALRPDGPAAGRGSGLRGARPALQLHLAPGHPRDDGATAQRPPADRLSAVLAIGLLPFGSTLAGGLAAMRLRHALHPFMAVAAGILVATALGDLLPEAIALLGADRIVLAGGLAVVGFLLFTSVEAFLHREAWEHEQADAAGLDESAGRSAGHSHLGLIAPAGLIVHSTLDGFAIGLGFAREPAIGLIVLVAVLAHDFADGMNVVTLAFVGGRRDRTAIVLLVLDALAPILGIALSGLLVPTDAILGSLLAVFAGVFLAIGAGHLLPEAQHERPGEAPSLLVLVGGGAALVFAIRALLP
jgi:ZIP family zinc transporter